jgi:hypothetical protein
VANSQSVRRRHHRASSSARRNDCAQAKSAKPRRVRAESAATGRARRRVATIADATRRSGRRWRHIVAPAQEAVLLRAGVCGDVVRVERRCRRASPSGAAADRARRVLSVSRRDCRVDVPRHAAAGRHIRSATVSDSFWRVRYARRAAATRPARVHTGRVRAARSERRHGSLVSRRPSIASAPISR